MRRSLLLVAVMALLASALGGPALATGGTLAWQGQGGGSVDCESYEPGTVHWILQAGRGATISDVVLHVPGEDPEPMDRRGGNTWSAYTGFGDGVVIDDVLSFPGDQPYVSYSGQLGTNPRLLVSGFCFERPTGSILLAKSYSVTPLDLAAFDVYSAVMMDGELVAGELVTAMTRYDDDLYCADGLLFGDYVVVESQVPTGFAPVPDQVVTVDTESTCMERLAADPIMADLEILNEATPIEVTVTKRKLAFEDGELVPTDTPLAGFVFELIDTDTDLVLATGTSGTDGVVRWDDDPDATTIEVEVPGSYEVCEIGTPEPGYWSDADCQSFDAALDTDVSLTFFNAPRADVEVGFTDVTGYTSAWIACYDADGELVAETSLTSTGSLELDALDLGDYSCDIQIRNGTTPVGVS